SINSREVPNFYLTIREFAFAGLYCVPSGPTDRFARPDGASHEPLTDDLEMMLGMLPHLRRRAGSRRAPGRDPRAVRRTHELEQPSVTSRELLERGWWQGREVPFEWSHARGLEVDPVHAVRCGHPVVVMRFAVERTHLERQAIEDCEQFVEGRL